MDYDLRIIYPTARKQMPDSAKKKSSERLQVTETAVTRIYEYRDYSVGILVFPELKHCKPGRNRKRIIKKAQDLRPKVNLLLGLSLWGYFREKRFLKDHLGVLDTLLGSGCCPYQKAKYFHNKKTLWIRPLSKGKTVCKITIPNWPQKNKSRYGKPARTSLANCWHWTNKSPLIQRYPAIGKSCCPRDDGYT